MESSDERPPKTGVPGWLLPFVVLVLLAVSGYSLFGLVRERRHTEDLASSNRALTASLQQVQNELRAVSQKLNAIPATPAPAPVVEERRPAHRAVARVAVRHTVRKSASDRRLEELQARVADQQKQLASAREELQNQLGSTRDELNGSIAKTHEELVSLQKRGERNYYEFELDKSKRFERVGPLSLSLRKVNFKHRYYDLTMLLDDQELQKKHVNLYEPLLLSVSDRPQPIELVVNEISPNHVKGYISEPKYTKSELAVSAPAAPVPEPKALRQR